MKYFKLFITGFIQVVLVCINTWQIANQKYIGIAFVGFLISIVWTLNVKAIAFGSWYDRLIYAIGASLGSISGVIIAEYFYY